MQCNSGTELVCYNYEKCPMASKCFNVPRGIRKKIKETQEKKRRKR